MNYAELCHDFGTTLIDKLSLLEPPKERDRMVKDCINIVNAANSPELDLREPLKDKSIDGQKPEQAYISLQAHKSIPECLEIFFFKNPSASDSTIFKVAWPPVSEIAFFVSSQIS